jgi:hypothetical protein
MHWEWRGFGRLDPRLRERIAQLPLAYPTARTITDRYLWVPGLGANIKLRSWPGGTSLKFKYPYRSDPTDEMGLWIERPEEDHLFPLPPSVVTQVSTELCRELRPKDGTWGCDELLAELHATGVQVVTVQKWRRLFRWSHEDSVAFVELAEIQSPEQIETVGIEDGMGLSDASVPAAVATAREVVLTAKDQFGLPANLKETDYLEALATWAGGGSVA